MKKIKISIILNSIIFILVTLGTIFMMTGFKFMAQSETLSVTKLGVFKFFTVDSNIFFGIVSLIFLIYEILLIKKKIKKIPIVIYVLKLISTAAVVLTFTVTLCYLVPTSEYSWLFFYQNSNLFFHLIVPILGIITFIFFDYYQEIPYKYTFYSLLPMFLYSIYYSSNIFLHIKNGNILPKYDFYGFLRNGTNLIFIVVIIMILLTYTIGYTLWKFNIYRGKKK